MKRKLHYKTKTEAYRAFFAYLSAPYLLAIGLVIVASKSGLTLEYSTAQMRQVIIIGIIGVAVVLIYSWTRMFQIYFEMNRNDFNKLPGEDYIPETVICLKCRQPISGKSIETMICPKCGGTLENLIGFYERHPELRNEKGI